MPLSVKDLSIDLAVRYGFQVMGAVVILIVGALVARWIGRLAEEWLERRHTEPPIRTLAVRVVRVVVLVFALVVALDKFGFQVAPLVAGIGVAGIGIGIALQGVLVQRRRRPHDHPDQALPRGRAHRAARRVRRREPHRAVLDDARASRPVARRHSQPEDRRGDPPQLRDRAAAPAHRPRGVPVGSGDGPSPWPARCWPRTRACCASPSPWWGSRRWPSPGSRWR